MLTTIKHAISALVGIPGQLELIREAVASYDPQGWRSAASEVESLRLRFQDLTKDLDDSEQQLAAEREAHAEDRNQLIVERKNVEGQAKAAKYWHDNYTRVCGELTESQQQLTSEREAHAEDNERFDSVSRHAQELESKLTSALDKLDKLTRWIDTPCELPGHLPVQIERSDGDHETVSAAWFRALLDPSKRRWRYTVESLQALEESEGGDGS